MPWRPKICKVVIFPWAIQLVQQHADMLYNLASVFPMKLSRSCYMPKSWSVHETTGFMVYNNQPCFGAPPLDWCFFLPWIHEYILVILVIGKFDALNIYNTHLTVMPMIMDLCMLNASMLTTIPPSAVASVYLGVGWKRVPMEKKRPRFEAFCGFQKINVYCKCAC